MRLPRATRFLVCPHHDPDRALGLKPQGLDQAKRLPGSHTSARIIHRTRTDIPGIDVSADYNDLFRLFAADDFANHIS